MKNVYLLLMCGRGNKSMRKRGKRAAQQKATNWRKSGQQFSVQKKQRSDSAFVLWREAKTNFIQEEFHSRW